MLPKPALDLLASSGRFLVLRDSDLPDTELQPDFIDAGQTREDAIRAAIDEMNAAIMPVIEHITTIEADCRHLREQLEKIGKKAFWARGKTDPPRTE